MKHSTVITPFIKSINNIPVVLWDYVERAYLYEQFTMRSEDYAEYSPILFEKL